MKPRKNLTENDTIIRNAGGFFLPFALMFGFYVIMHGNLSPGGGFQGGVCGAGAVVLLFLGYGYDTAVKAIHPEFIRKNEAVGATAYVIIALCGIFAGANFCRNVFYQNGAVGDLFSAGTIGYMNYAVGYKVLTGVSFLLILLFGTLSPEWDKKQEENLKASGNHTEEELEGGAVK